MVFKYDIKPRNNTLKPKYHCAMSNAGKQFQKQNQTKKQHILDLILSKDWVGSPHRELSSKEEYGEEDLLVPCFTVMSKI